MKALTPILLTLSLSMGMATAFAQNTQDSLLYRLSEESTLIDSMVVYDHLVGQLSFSDPQQALDYALEWLRISQNADSLPAVFQAQTSLGRIYNIIGDYGKATDTYFKALDIANTLSDQKTLAIAYNNLAIAFRLQKASKKAINYFKKAADLCSKSGHYEMLANIENNIGSVYYDLRELDSASVFYTKAYNYFKEVNDAQGLALVENNLGELFYEKGEFLKAIDNFIASLVYFKSVGDADSQSYIENNLAKAFLKINRLEEAEKWATASLERANSLGALRSTEESTYILASIKKAAGQHLQAIELLERSLTLRDSLYSIENLQALDAQQSSYELKLKQAEIDLLEREKLLAETELKNQAYFKYLAALVVLLALAVVFLAMLYSRRQLNKSKTFEEKNRVIELQSKEINKTLEELKSKNIELEKQKEEINFLFEEAAVQRQLYEESHIILEEAQELIERQHAELSQSNGELEKRFLKIEEQKRAITSSITYASRIQRGLFQDIKEQSDRFTGLMVLLKPRDIVSGDFYWFGHLDNKKIVVAADCTGHGVPGAFMTVMGNDYLNEIVYGSHITEPNAILDALDKRVRSAFDKGGDDNLSVNDGMDMAIAVYDSQDQTVAFSGAKNPLYFVRKGQAIEEIKGSKFPIGSSQFKMEKVFERHVINMQSGDIFYLCSDGFQDQFGGTDNRKYMTKRFRELLEKASKYPIAEQQDLLDQEITEWMGDHHQTDDILVVGVQFC